MIYHIFAEISRGMFRFPKNSGRRNSIKSRRPLFWTVSLVPAILKSFDLSCSCLLKLCVSDDQAVNFLLGSRCLIILVNDFLKTCLYVLILFFFT